MYVSERAAGKTANRVWAALAAKQITRRQALNLLERISHCLSTSQFTKLMDLQDAVRYNPHLLDEK
jgi:hypothetical protein